jgi:hypothetical protein
MRRGDGVKVGCLTTGDLMDVWKRSKKYGVKLAMRSQPKPYYQKTTISGKG